MKIYMAARFSRRHELHEYSKALQAAGHTIVSRWTLPGTDHVKPAGMSRQAADAERERFAREDIEDIRNCDWMISFTEQPRGNSRGGRHVEFGYGLSLGVQMTVIGPRETVFHHLPCVRHFDCWADFADMMEGE